MATEEKQDINALLAEIAALKQENGELKSQLKIVPNPIRFESLDIDNILDEVEENEQKYQKEKVYHYDNKQDEEDEEINDKKKTVTFWNDLDKKLKEGDIEFVKDLVRTKELKIDEVNNRGRNLLMMATQHGSYELVSMCINLGADIDKQDNSQQTGLFCLILH